LQTALEDFFDECKEISPITMELIYEIDDQPFINTSLHLFRMIQEMVHNGMKHSGASQLLVQLKQRKRKIYLLYSDNGQGLITDKIKNAKGLGIQSIQNRAEMLGGKMITAEPGKKGTNYFFEIPMEKQ
jgi:signal transduction histidine kinase